MQLMLDFQFRVLPTIFIMLAMDETYGMGIDEPGDKNNSSKLPTSTESQLGSRMPYSNVEMHTALEIILSSQLLVTVIGSIPQLMLLSNQYFTSGLGSTTGYQYISTNMLCQIKFNLEFSIFTDLGVSS